MSDKDFDLTNSDLEILPMNIQEALKISKSANLERLDGLKITIVEYDDLNKQKIITQHHDYILSDFRFNENDFTVFVLNPDNTGLGVGTTMVTDQGQRGFMIESYKPEHPELFFDETIASIKKGQTNEILDQEGVTSITSYRLGHNDKGNPYIIKDHITNSPETTYSVPITPSPEQINDFNILYACELNIVNNALENLSGFQLNHFKSETDLDGLAVALSVLSDFIEHHTGTARFSPNYKHTFNEILKSFNLTFDQEQKKKTKLPKTNTTKYLTNNDSFIKALGKDVRGIYQERYSKEDLENGKSSFGYIVGTNKKDKSDMVVRIVVRTEKELMPIHDLIRDAYYTLRELNPNEPIPIIDIVNTIHPRESGDKFRQNDPYAQRLFQEVKFLTQTGLDVNITDISEYYTELEKEGWLAYNENIGVNIFSTTCIPAEIELGPLPNGKLAHRLIPHRPLHKDPFYNYIKATNQIKSFKGSIRFNPLHANEENDTLYYYLLTEIYNMPYHQKQKFIKQKKTYNKQISFINTRYQEEAEEIKKEYQNEIFKLKNTPAFKTLTPNEQQDQILEKKQKKEKELSALKRKNRKEVNEILKPLKERQNIKIKEWECRIKVDTVMETQKLTKRRFTVIKAIKKSLDYLKLHNFILDYKEIKEGKTIHAFDIMFF